MRRPSPSTLFPYTTLFRSLNLAQAAVYLALAPKSNASYEGLKRARAWVREHGAPEIPMHLRSEEHTSELQSQFHLVCRLLLEKKKINQQMLRRRSCRSRSS